MKSPYRERDYTFGQTMLTLRTQINLTQERLSNHLGVSRRAVGEWEAGNSYPKTEHLKELITLAVKSQAFPEESIAQEIRTLWKAARQKVFLDESWLTSLLEHSRSPQPHPVPKPVEEGKEAVGTELAAVQEASPLPAPTPTTPLPRVDWGDASAVPTFYGREEELALLSQWIVQERCRVVSVLGMGGIGKSALAVNTMYRLAGGTGQEPCTVPTACPFEVVIFRSLHDALSCEELLAECLQAFSPQPLDEISAGQAQDTIPTEQRLGLLLSHLRQVRVLLVLDNLECLLGDRDTRGHFRPGFERYGWLLRRVAETTHQSCLLFTSREKPADLRLLEGTHSPVRSLRLAGLDASACQHLIEEKEIVGSQQEQAQLIEAYSGNPLALKIVGETIVDLFGGKIGSFLASESPVIFGSITDLLDEQFSRLSHLEQTVLYWLAIMREPVTFDELLMVLVSPIPRAQILEAVNSLRQRSLIELGKRPGSFTLQSVVLEYVTAAFIAEASSEIQRRRLDRLTRHSLSLATAREYIRQKQERLLLSPLLAHLQSVYPRRAEVEKQLLSLLDELRERADYAQGYGPANLITLLRLQREHLFALDLPHLSIHGASLQDTEMHDVSPVGVQIRDTVLTEAVNTTCAVTINQQEASLDQTHRGNTMSNDANQPTDTNQITRRGLIELAFVASPVLTNMRRERLNPSVIEEFLSEATASITACWHLQEDGLTLVERALSQYLPLLEGLVKHSSLYRQQAAYLAAQAFLLLDSVAYHYLRFADGIGYCEQAVEYAREAGDLTLLLVSLEELGSALRAHGPETKMIDIYQQAEQYSTSSELSGILRSKVRSGLGLAAAQQGKSEEATQFLNEARALFMEENTELPAFLVGCHSLSDIILSEGRSDLALGDIEQRRRNTSGALEYYKRATEKLAGIERFPANIIAPSWSRVKIDNYRALAYAKAGNLTEFEKYFIKGANGAKKLGSNKREQEAWDNLILVLHLFPHETRLTGLVELLR